MRHADDAGFTYRRMAHERILEIDGADPLAARLDHVFAAVHQAYAAIGVDRGHVAGAEPAVGGPAILGAGRVVIFASDPGAADLQFAHGLAIPGSNALIIGDAQLQ